MSHLARPTGHEMTHQLVAVVLFLVLGASSTYAAHGNLTFQDAFHHNVLAKNLDDLSSNGGNLIKNQTDFYPVNSSSSFFDANHDLLGGQKLNFFGSSSLKGGGLTDKLDESIQKMMKAFSSQTKNLGTADFFKGNISQFGGAIVKRDKNSRASPKKGQADDIWTNLEGQNRNRFDEKYRFIRHVEFDKFNNRLGLALSRLSSDQEIQALTKKVVSLMGNGYYFIIFNCTKPMFISADNKVETLASKAALEVLKKDDACQPSKSAGANKASSNNDDIWHYRAEPPADFSTYDFKAQAISEQILPFTKLLEVFSRVGLCDDFLRFMNHPAYFFDDNRFAKPKICAGTGTAEPGTKSKERGIKKSRDGNKRIRNGA